MQRLFVSIRHLLKTVEMDSVTDISYNIRIDFHGQILKKSLASPPNHQRQLHLFLGG